MSTFLTICLLISLATINPTTGQYGIVDNLWKTMRNIISLKFGGIKFLADFFQYKSRELNSMTPNFEDEYDFIIVGGGAAGAVMAARLSEIQQAKVLLIEAGGQENLIMDIPLIAIYLQYDKNMHWNYATESSDSYCLGMKNHQCTLNYGKVMGGSSTINTMMATRGNRRDYDRWADITNDGSWSYEGMLKYFKKLEKHDVTKTSIDTEYHGFDGPVRITDVPYRTRYVHSWAQAGEELGLPPVDYNGRKQAGLNYLQTNQLNGERVSTNKAYLRRIKQRKNLYVSMFSHVDKILIDAETKTAIGVEFSKKGRKIQVFAKKEVIICAGPINSPKLLMLSGIGPQYHLKDIGIPLLQDSPVGENLMDHLTFLGLNFLTNDTGSILAPDLVKPNNQALNDYLIDRKGPLTVPTGIEGVGYVNVDSSRADEEPPNLEIMFSGVNANYYQFKVTGLTDAHYKRSFAEVNNKHGFQLWPVVLQPKSRGKILLRDANPKSSPRIIPNYFSDPDDIRLSIKGIKMALEISETNAFKRHGTRLVHRAALGCEHLKLYSDPYWECALRTLSQSIWHHSGACKMGQEYDPTAVVNPKLQVKGIKRLRVVDASIMPMIPTAHLNIPTMAVAEKAADMIKCEWGFTLDFTACYTPDRFEIGMQSNQFDIDIRDGQAEIGKRIKSESDIDIRMLPDYLEKNSK
ncbi:hypothetical protein QAD02_015834 [Eretmocerus hayati]|uniref:Uncharacterized protein n=1 Tax=Eretmocerus hayati TaxID=131215 RepID=A0ACC2P9R6_9HYME|nr:hypothetical protein QAD02_015834 [Eretmocerus hayati]